MGRSLIIGTVLAVLPLAAAAQDAVKADPSHYKVLIDNPAVRVLKIDVPAGAKSVMHSHPDAMLVSLSDAKAHFTLADGKTLDSDIKKDSALYTPATTHNPENVGTTAVDALLVEFKTASPGTATLPTTRPAMQLTTLAEGPRASAFKSTASPDFHEPAGSAHDFDQVVIALAPADMTLTVEGKPPVKKWNRGDAQFIGRGVKHESQNASGKPIDFLIVAIK